MIIDIQRTVIKTQLRRFLTLIGFIILATLVILSGNFIEKFLGLSNIQWVLIVGGIYLLTIILEAFLELNYIYFSDEDNLIILRYFSMSVFNQRKNSIEIPKSVYSRYELKKSLFGVKTKIILYQRLKDKDVKYRGVSITGLNKNEIKVLTKTLDRYK